MGYGWFSMLNESQNNGKKSSAYARGMDARDARDVRIVRPADGRIRSVNGSSRGVRSPTRVDLVRQQPDRAKPCIRHRSSRRLPLRRLRAE